MLYDPADHYEPVETAQDFKQKSKIYERFMNIKQSRLLRFLKRKQGGGVAKTKSILHHFFNF
jgi:hypothetical protein